ncbi:hypothetical protein [Janthinobacterium sp. SUN206]|uniref:hypothetical protein n=1 Tax=Janthinobacterium sp. SUN206 TaxID=3014787 RepID=UPI002712BC2E|nr:hypothetical protein [Janthinobacterium sp. SUN206]MDO8065603.1 hypothetical protein [Janthinobacterium sp. SUN206]
MTNTTKTAPAESIADNAVPGSDKELMDAIDATDMQDGEQLAKGGTRGGLVSDNTDIA